jgi:hypothetical protein
MRLRPVGFLLRQGYGGQVGGQIRLRERQHAGVPGLELDLRARGLVAGSDMGAKDRDISSDLAQHAADSLVLGDGGAASNPCLRAFIEQRALPASVLGPVMRAA